jgi:hypothetical protein
MSQAILNFLANVDNYLYNIKFKKRYMVRLVCGIDPKNGMVIPIG